jgi:uncharacterized membrane protein YhiD involved in acid resistance
MILSIPGLVRTLLIIIAVIVILRFVGQMMNAKRNMDDEKRLNRQKQKEEDERKRYEQNKGRVSISQKSTEDAEDADFEEVKN